MENIVKAIYYSPTGTSGKVAEAVATSVANSFGIGDASVIDITLGKRELVVEDCMTVIAAPVYGGRIAPTAVERLESVTAKNALCAVIAVYGNRDYEDALLELVNLSRARGFIPVAAGAFIGEHSYSTEEYPIAADRPDSADLEKAARFGEEIATLFKNIRSAMADMADNGARERFLDGLPLPAVKGNMPYKEYKPSPATPQTDGSICVLCGRCIDMCPVGCIEMKDDEHIVSDPSICTKCCACVKGCPFGARIFNTPYSEMLHKNFSVRKEPEWLFS